jgi:hypothetical protein
MTPRELMSRIVWGKPDARPRLLCALCHGALPEVPLMLWKEDGSGASFCDACAEQVFQVLKPSLRSR